MGLKRIIDRIRGKSTSEEEYERERARTENEQRREELIDEHYEDGFPSADAVKGNIWIQP